MHAELQSLSLTRTRTAYPDPYSRRQVDVLLHTRSSPASTRSSSRESLSSHLSHRSSATSYASSYHSEYNFDTVPKLTKTPWELSRSRGPFTARSGTSRSPDQLEPLPAHIFENMPDEIYKCIVQQLETVHKTKSMDLCPACFMRDLFSLCLTSKPWYNSAKAAL